MSEEEAAAVRWATCKVCRDCIHGFGETSDDNTPVKANCKIYPYGSGRAKPVDVLMNGAPCEFYEKHPNPPKYFVIGKTPIAQRPDGTCYFDITATPDEEFRGLDG